MERSACYGVWKQLLNKVLFHIFTTPAAKGITFSFCVRFYSDFLIILVGLCFSGLLSIYQIRHGIIVNRKASFNYHIFCGHIESGITTPAAEGITFFFRGFSKSHRCIKLIRFRFSYLFPIYFVCHFIAVDFKASLDHYIMCRHCKSVFMIPFAEGISFLLRLFLKCYCTSVFIRFFLAISTSVYLIRYLVAVNAEWPVNDYIFCRHRKVFLMVPAAEGIAFLLRGFFQLHSSSIQIRLCCFIRCTVYQIRYRILVCSKASYNHYVFGRHGEVFLQIPATELMPFFFQIISDCYKRSVLIGFYFSGLYSVYLIGHFVAVNIKMAFNYHILRRHTERLSRDRRRQ